MSSVVKKEKKEKKIKKEKKEKKVKKEKKEKKSKEKKEKKEKTRKLVNDEREKDKAPRKKKKRDVGGAFGNAMNDDQKGLTKREFLTEEGMVLDRKTKKSKEKKEKKDKKSKKDKKDKKDKEDEKTLPAKKIKSGDDSAHDDTTSTSRKRKSDDSTAPTSTTTTTTTATTTTTTTTKSEKKHKKSKRARTNSSTAAAAVVVVVVDPSQFVPSTSKFNDGYTDEYLLELKKSDPAKLKQIRKARQKAKREHHSQTKALDNVAKDKGIALKAAQVKETKRKNWEEGQAAKRAEEEALWAGKPTKVFIGGLPFGVSERRLQKFFIRCGMFAHVDMPVFEDSGRSMGVAHMYVLDFLFLTTI